ncbi:MAG: glycosyltransferase family 2 protein [Nitrososphaerota archaeon]|jgi:glycosyltransferase involved in cell wall biosynthesis|nr:glycosyltransferase family 2 protein [Nitrososphaerota archaeon]
MGILKTQTLNRKTQLDLTVVLPAINEADIIEQAVLKIDQVLKTFGYTYEIIIAEDGSTDGTDKKAAKLAKKLLYIRHLHNDQRFGRGKALDNSFRQSNGKVLIYMDVDLATDLKHLTQLINAIFIDGYFFATGSRMLSNSNVKRTSTRIFASKTFNFMVRMFLYSKVKDHQCGFKAFERNALLPLLDEVHATHWFWDTEILVRAQHKGYKIKEIPVSWAGVRETKVHLFRDSVAMGWQIFILWLHLH